MEVANEQLENSIEDSKRANVRKQISHKIFKNRSIAFVIVLLVIGYLNS